MKYFLLLLVIPLQAQPGQLFTGDTLHKNEQFIKLPGLPKRSVFDASAALITSDSVYKTLFGDSAKQLPEIDFSRYELISRSYCKRCATVCNGFPGCHRDACRYSRYWIKADKSNRTEIKPLLREGYSMSGLHEGLLVISSDSMLQQNGVTGAAVDFTRTVLLTNSIFSDCNARFRHEFFLDADRQCLVWRMFEHKGGCAAMDRHPFFFETARIPQNYRVVFEIYPETLKRR